MCLNLLCSPSSGQLRGSGGDDSFCFLPLSCRGPGQRGEREGPPSATTLLAGCLFSSPNKHLKLSFLSCSIAGGSREMALVQATLDCRGTPFVSGLGGTHLPTPTSRCCHSSTSLKSPARQDPAWTPCQLHPSASTSHHLQAGAPSAGQCLRAGVLPAIALAQPGYG